VSLRTIAVCGGGHGAVVAAGDLALRGFDVRLALRNRERFADLFESGRVELDGAIEGSAELALVSDDHAAAVRGAELVIMPLPVAAQIEMATKIASAVQENQVVYLTKGTFGAPFVRRTLASRPLVTENAILPYGTRLTGGRSARVGMVAEHLPTGAYPAVAGAPALALAGEAYPATIPAEDALDASLLNFDPALHAPLVLMNAGPIERLPEFDIHRQGNPQSVVAVSLALDAERIALRRALGYEPPDWPLEDLYSRVGTTFFGVLSEERMAQHSVWSEKIDFRHRYVEEDIGWGLTLWSLLGRWLRVPTPVTESMLVLASTVNGFDYASGGHAALGLDLNGTTVADLRRRLGNGDV